MAIHTADRTAETFWAGGNTFSIIDDGSVTDGRIGIVECRLDPGWAGPPQHVHHEHDETLYVLSGRVWFASGDERVLATSGELITVPRGTPHTFGNADADEPASVLGTFTPAPFVGFFRELAKLQPNEHGRIDPAAMKALMARYASSPAVV